MSKYVRCSNCGFSWCYSCEGTAICLQCGRDNSEQLDISIGYSSGTLKRNGGIG